MQSAGHQTYWSQSFNHLQYWCLNSYLGESFQQEQRLKFFDMVYHQEGFCNEEPLDYVHHCLQWYRVFIDSMLEGMAEERQAVMLNAPLDWGTIVHHSTMANIEEVLNAVNASQKALHCVWLQEQWRERGYP